MDDGASKFSYVFWIIISVHHNVELEGLVIHIIINFLDHCYIGWWDPLKIVDRGVGHFRSIYLSVYIALIWPSRLTGR